jgi:hypothetical protein
VEHVRLMTTALRAVTRQVAAERGESPSWAGDGVEVEIHYERPPSPFPRLAAVHPITGEGRNADPRAALALFDADEDALLSAEAERVARFERWLEAQPLTKPACRRHLRNARELTRYLALQVVTTPGCTEFDLRHYLYVWLPRHVRLPRDVGRAIPQSLRTWFDWLSAREGISCPWAAGVLDEIPGVLTRVGLDADAAWWDEPDAEWPAAFWIDAGLRGFVPDRELPGTGGWPVLMTGDVAVAREILNRHWLLWYDELVRAGLTDLDLLWQALARRQHAWEKEPLAELGGRTPRDVVRDQEGEADDSVEGDERDVAELYDLLRFGKADPGTSRR